jgi:hypothetical protein
MKLLQDIKHMSKKTKLMSAGKVFLKEKISSSFSLFGWLVADGWCWFVLREEYCWLVAGG